MEHEGGAPVLEDDYHAGWPAPQDEFTTVGHKLLCECEAF